MVGQDLGRKEERWMAVYNGFEYDPCPGWFNPCGMVGRTRVGKILYCKHCAWMKGSGEKRPVVHGVNA